MRRGLNIDHPVPDGQGDYNHRGDFDIDQVINQPHPDEQQVVREIDDDTGDIDPSAEEVLGNLPDAPSDAAQDVDEDLFESDPQGTPDTRDSVMADSSVTTPKRGNSDGQGGSDAKRGLFGGRGQSLPGTAGGQGSGNNLGEDSIRPFKLPKPIVSIQNNVQYFRKVHRFYTHGFAYKVLQQFPNAQSQTISTPLALVPWDRLHFYVNPSEFALLPPQASVQHVQCKVYQRNVRVAFPTNSTVGALATLNQNKNIVYSLGLNQKCDIIPIKYTTYAADQPMVPTAATRWKTQDAIDDMNNWYNSEGNLIGANAVVPRHQMGQPDVLRVYAGLIYRTEAGDGQDGWECLQTHVEESDADATSGGLLVKASYTPGVGICKPPKKIVNRAHAPGVLEIARGSHQLANHVTQITQGINEVNSVNHALNPQDQIMNGLNNPYQLVEKSQTHNEGLFMHEGPKVQPSLHIGVQPTYAITSTTVGVNNSFTDTQAYFEVVAEAWIDTNFSTFRPLTKQSNVRPGNYWSHNTKSVAYGQPLFDGLYQATAL